MVASLADDQESDVPEVTDERFRAVFSRLATGVMVLTTEADGAPHGMTVNAVTSVSLDPHLVLVCVERGTVMESLIEKSRHFALSILPERCEHLSVHFADSDRPAGAAQFEGVGTTTRSTGAPVLDCSLAWVDCRVWATYDGGDHVVVVGEVVDLGLADDEGRPLVYYRSGYHTIGEQAPDDA